jgi:hypothetical protein
MNIFVHSDIKPENYRNDLNSSIESHFSERRMMVVELNTILVDGLIAL